MSKDKTNEIIKLDTLNNITFPDIDTLSELKRQLANETACD